MKTRQQFDRRFGKTKTQQVNCCKMKSAEIIGMAVAAQEAAEKIPENYRSREDKVLISTAVECAEKYTSRAIRLTESKYMALASEANLALNMRRILKSAASDEQKQVELKALAEFRLDNLWECIEPDEDADVVMDEIFGTLFDIFEVVRDKVKKGKTDEASEQVRGYDEPERAAQSTSGTKYDTDVSGEHTGNDESYNRGGTGREPATSASAGNNSASQEGGAESSDDSRGRG
jgi:hypothetical protein